ncbi:MAG: nucleoside hydrolase [Leadbetterella sp.]
MKIILTALLLLLYSPQLLAQTKQKVWLDADTGNEMDDVWAIARLLYAKDKVDIIGISSAHFNNPDLLTYKKWNQYKTRGINTVEISQKINEEILKAANMRLIKAPRGASKQMGRAWGQNDPRASEATEVLLSTIKSLKLNEKLDILCLGATTNIASLIALDTTVKSKIRLYSMGFKFNPKSKIWNKNDFNSRVDLNAADYLLNQTGLDWHIIPVYTCLPYKYKIEELERFDENEPVERIMKKRWLQTNPDNKERILWDLALVQAYLNPELIHVMSTNTPPENHQHQVKIYTDIHLNEFYQDFWKSVEDNRSKLSSSTKKP